MKRLLGLVIGLALIGGAVFAQTHALSPAERTAPLGVTGGFREVIRTENFAVRLERLESAGSVTYRNLDGRSVTVETEHLFLIAMVGATSLKRVTTLRTAYLRTASGLRYDHTDKVSPARTLSAKSLQPSWWRSGFYVFEVPASALRGAKIIVMEAAVNPLGERLLPQAELDLGLDEAGATRMAAEARENTVVIG
ncbi:hypothetical protein [Rhizohabitans arisaemae]|uniref:hypothetical protein n=1 Tax=Rhizohabitans arisaemae TaxID=2720610 RepID=UPI0024B1951F|nr:hypothetical protein [Rhizohabitans arisaemae]